MDTVTICMGSSCFGKGNSSIAEYITTFISEHNLTDKIEVSGCLCEKLCGQGPNIKINGKIVSGVSEQTIADILIKELELQV